jgi:nucleoid-associated protein YgaU
VSHPEPPPSAAAPAITPVTPVTPAVSSNPLDTWPVYTVQPSDTLWTISERCYGDGAQYQLLVTANKLRSTAITSGMKLRVPGGKLPPAVKRMNYRGKP